MEVIFKYETNPKKSKPFPIDISLVSPVLGVYLLDLQIRISEIQTLNNIATKTGRKIH